MKLDDLRKLYIHELKDLWSAEHQILEALPKMIDGAADRDLAKAFRDHLRETEGQVERLERIFAELDGARPGGHKCKGMEGLLEEGESLFEEEIDREVLDAALIGAAQRVEHYEIAAYGTARNHAELLGEGEAARLLQESLDEEAGADERLTGLADRRINAGAMS